MKQKDYMLIGVIIFISALLSIVISNSLFNTSSSHKKQVDIVQPISSAFTLPDTKYINSSSFDPTQPITITQNNNSNPFGQ